MDNDELNINDVIDGANLTVPFVQTTKFTQVHRTSVLYGMVEFHISYNIRLNSELPGSAFSATYYSYMYKATCILSQ